MSQKTIDNISIWFMLIASMIIIILIIISGCCHFYKSHYRGDWKEEPLIKKQETI
jgi:hypothetical protein